MKRILLSLIVAFALTMSAKNKIELSSMSKYHEFKLDINLPAAGLYIVKVIGEKSTAMKKVVVE